MKVSYPFSGLWRTVFGAWDWRDKLFGPVMVNLITASLIFLAAVIFKDPILDYFVRSEGTADWPIYCVVEPEPNDGGAVIADLFVMNTTTEKFSGSDLDTLARSRSSHEKGISPLIDVQMKASAPDSSILEVKSDEEFNKEKGSASFERVDSRHWRIRLEEIDEGKILKFMIRTDAQRPISSRSSFETLPITVKYARSP